MRRNTGENPRQPGERQRSGQSGQQPPQQGQPQGRGSPQQGPPPQQQGQPTRQQRQPPQQQQGQGMRRQGQQGQQQPQQMGGGGMSRGGRGSGMQPPGQQQREMQQTGMGGQQMQQPPGQQLQQSGMGGQQVQQQQGMGGQQMQQPQVEGPTPMPIDDIIETEVVTAEPDETVPDLVNMMEQQEVGSVILTQEGEPVGVVTDRKIALSLTQTDEPSELTAEDVSSEELIVGQTENNIYEILNTMSEANIRRLPIVDEDGQLEGIITLDDLLVFIKSELTQATDIIESQSPRL